MIDHISIPVRDLQASARFYEAVLAPLGFSKLVEREGTVGLGKRYPEFWLNLRPDRPPSASGDGFHICVRARDEAAVKRFFDSALELGGVSAGEPGPRQAAMTGYYAAFIEDPDGHRIEAACFPATTG
jgi:catechol 2,3-dioxygenase-like lactoylglutathione lyase family enzyme